MLTILDRYIAKQVLQSVLFTLLILIALRTLFTLLDEAGKIGEGTYQFTQAAYYALLMIPTRLYEFFPMAMLVGGLTALGTLAAQNELTVMRAAGIKTGRIIGGAIKAAAPLILLILIAGEWLAPLSSKQASQLRAEALSGNNIQSSESGIWARSNNDFVHIRSIMSERDLAQLTIFQFAQTGTLRSVIEAKRAKYVDNQWVLFEVTRRTHEPNQVTGKKEAQLPWDGNLAPRHIAALQTEPEMLTLDGLIGYQEYLSDNALDASRFELAFWRKITQPLSLVVMIVLASSFVFGPMRSVTMGARLLTGIIVGFAFHIANNFLGPLSLVYQLPALFGAFIPIIVFFGIAVLLLKRAH